MCFSRLGNKYVRILQRIGTFTPALYNRGRDRTFVFRNFSSKCIIMSSRDRTYTTTTSNSLVHDIFTGSSSVLKDSKAQQFCTNYLKLETEARRELLMFLSDRYSVDHDQILQTSKAFMINQDKGEGIKIRTEERLRSALTPKYHDLFSRIGRLEHGVKFLVDLRTDLLDLISDVTNNHPYFYRLQVLNTTLRELLSLWFSVGFLQLERVTWNSSCEMLEKISEYEAVHPVRNWTDLKKRVGLYRRCFVYTHSSMPREPVVVLHTALTNCIPSTIQSIVASQMLNSEDLTNHEEDPKKISAAIFYSISSTQKGLQGIELGTQLIKRVVREVLVEFPHITQFSSLSPIPGFREWLLSKMLTTDSSVNNSMKLFTADEFSKLENCLSSDKSTKPLLVKLAKYISNNSWKQDEKLSALLEIPLMRICSHYLYKEKRRGFALNSVANFHLRNGAVLWRLNWQANLSPRGLGSACGMMVNYRYFLDNVEEYSQQYMERQLIQASDQFLQKLKLIAPTSNL